MLFGGSYFIGRSVFFYFLSKNMCLKPVALFDSFSCAMPYVFEALEYKKNGQKCQRKSFIEPILELNYTNDIYLYWNGTTRPDKLILTQKDTAFMAPHLIDIWNQNEFEFVI